MEDKAELIGQTLGQYQMLEKIGEGGMAVVYKAYQPGLKREVAVKVLSPVFAKNKQFSERFQREVEAIGNLHHPNILSVYDSGQDKGYSYLVMRYIPNARTLSEEMNKSLLPSRIVELIDQIAQALDYAHNAGIIHRDIKPSNVLMAEHGALLSDFGLAKLVESNEQLTGSGVGMGTPSYMSPEQAMGQKVDHRTDIYALGIILFEMLTGEIPHRGATPIATVVKRSKDPLPMPRSFNPNIPPAVEQVLIKALERDPKLRFNRAGEMAAALKSAYAQSDNTVMSVASDDKTFISKPQLTSETNPPPVAAKKFDLNALNLPVNIFGFGGLAGLVLIVLIGIGALIYLQLRPTRSPVTWQYIVDMSEGMNQPFPGETITRWEAAKTKLAADLKLAPTQINMGLRVFGQSDKCDDTSELIPANPNQTARLAAQIEDLTPSGKASPLTEAVVQAFSQLELSPDKRNALIILTNGADSCDPQGVDKVTLLVQRLNIRVDTYVVGVAIADPKSEQRVMAWAQAAKGVYLPASSSTSLDEVLEKIQENLTAEKRPEEIALAPTATPTVIPASPTPIPATATTAATATPTAIPALSAQAAYDLALADALKWQADASVNNIGTTILGPLTVDGTSASWDINFWSPTTKSMYKVSFINGNVFTSTIPLDNDPGTLPMNAEVILDTKRIYDIAQNAGGSQYMAQGNVPMAGLVPFPLDVTRPAWYINYQDSQTFKVVFTVIIDARSGEVINTVVSPN